MNTAISRIFFTSPRVRGEVDLRTKVSKSGEGEFHPCAIAFDCPSPGSHALATLSPQPKSDVSDFGQLLMPNSGKPELGAGRGKKEAVE